jgi:hypothetical protein
MVVHGERECGARANSGTLYDSPSTKEIVATAAMFSSSLQHNHSEGDRCLMFSFDARGETDLEKK